MDNEFEMLRKTCMAYEKKLIELMGENAFHEYATELARGFFADEICGMADGDFKETILDNFDAITGSEDDYKKLIGNIQKSHRDCENCAHCKPSENGVMGCESWSCEFKPKGDES